MKIGQYGGKFLPFHSGHHYAAMEALTHVDKLYIILFHNKEFDKQLCEKEGIKEMSPELRKSWIGHSISELRKLGKEVDLLEIEYDEMEYDWTKGTAQVRKMIPGLTHVFSSEPAYDQFFKVNYPNAKHVILDRDRSFVNISATEIRQDPFKYWEYILPITRPHFTKKILFTGVESVGKSTMARNLAKYFNTNYVHEIGRDYCEKHANQLTVKQFDNIAMKHWIAQQDALEHSNKYLFVDSDAVVTRYYLEKYHKGADSNLIKEIIKLQDYDQIFILSSEVDWVNDGYRFLESTRKEDETYLIEQYRMQLNMCYRLTLIRGNDYQQRMRDIIKLI